MKIRLVITALMALILASGCSKSDTPETNTYTPSDKAITFYNSPNNWSETKGTVYNKSTFNEMEIFAFYTAQKDWASALKDDISNFMYSQQVNYENDNWTYSPIKYWPNNTGDKLSFFAFAPHGAISCSKDATTNKPTFSYTMSHNVSENGDLSVATPKLNCTKETYNSGVTFDLNHVLTRLNLEGAITNMPTEEESLAQNEKNVRYIINGITFFNINSKADLVYENGVWEWQNLSTPFEYTASQGYSLLAYDDLNADLTETAKDIMFDKNTSIFVLPQDVKDATLQVRIRKEFDMIDNNGATIKENCEIIYATSSDIAIPTPDDKGWKAKDWITMTFTFDASTLSEYDTPMTISSKILDWTQTSVDASIHSNIYIYSSNSDIIATTENSQQYGEFDICTNYDYNMHVPHHREELDGDITTSRGFLFCSDDFNNTSYKTYHVGTVDGHSDYKVFMPTLLNKDKKPIKYATKNDILSALTSPYTGNVVYDSKNNFAYDLDTETGLHRLLYKDPSSGEIKPFTYKNDPITDYHEIDLTEFMIDNTVYFKVIIGKLDGTTDYSFDFSVKESTRTKEGLYVSTAIDENDKDNSYGVNKKGDDSVYIIRLSVDAEHLKEQGSFDDIIGVEMINNGGGLMTQLFPVNLKSE